MEGVFSSACWKQFLYLTALVAQRYIKFVPEGLEIHSHFLTLTLSVRLSVLIPCVQSEGQKYCDILMKFGTSKCYGSKSTLSVNIRPYFGKPLNE